MLIKPFKILDPEAIKDSENLRVLQFNTAKGVLNHVRNSIYVKSSEGSTPGHELFDVILVSDLIKQFDVLDYIEKYRPHLKDRAFMYDFMADNHKLSVFCKIVHTFNGVYRGDPEASFDDKLKNIYLYPSISYSIGKTDLFYEIDHRVLYMKHGSRTLSSVTYDISFNREELNLPACYDREDFAKAIYEKHLEGKNYIDIPDPRYPDMHPYQVGENYPRCLEIPSKFIMKDLLRDLINASVYIVDENKKDILELERLQEKRNEEIRRRMMSMDSDIANINYDPFELSLNMRVMARNIAVDFTKISICGMMESVELIYDFTTDQVQINKVRIPFDKVPTMFMQTTLAIITKEFRTLCKSNLKALTSLVVPNSTHRFRISVYDSSYEIIVKVSDLANKVSESIRLNKTETLHDYLIEGIHTADENKIVQNYNIRLLANPAEK